MAVPLMATDTVLVPAAIELSIPIATPLAFVVPGGCVRAFPLPVAASTTAAPLIRFPLASFAVTVIVAALAPDEAVSIAGDTVTVDWEELTGPAVAVALSTTGRPMAVA